MVVNGSKMDVLIFRPFYNKTFERPYFIDVSTFFRPFLFSTIHFIALT